MKSINVLLLFIGVVLSFSVSAKKVNSISPEVYDIISSRNYWEKPDMNNPVIDLDHCFAKGEKRGYKSKRLLNFIDGCMEGKGYIKKQLAIKSDA